MASEALLHHVVYEATADVVKICAALVTQEEKNEAFGRVYDRLHDALIDFEARNDRLKRWANPRWWN